MGLILRLIACLVLCLGTAKASIAPAIPFEFTFREPALKSYRIDSSQWTTHTDSQSVEWLKAIDSRNDTRWVYLGSRLALKLEPGTALTPLIKTRGLEVLQVVGNDFFLLNALDPWHAAVEADSLSQRPGVLISYPVMRRPTELDGPYAPIPNDTHFAGQGYLEFRDANGNPAGVDINARSAWPVSKGAGVNVAVVDLGVQLNHPELENQQQPNLHFNFVNDTPDGSQAQNSASWVHGTSVAGMILAEGDNQEGIIGTAPESGLASWVIFDTPSTRVADDKLMAMYQHQPNNVAIQNHSWGEASETLSGPTALELAGIGSAIQTGRNGLGVVMVRSAGNRRAANGNVNDDLYASDPRVIAVGAVNNEGQVTSYSEHGAPVLVSAPGGDAGLNLFTLDLTGIDGVNQFNFFPPNEDLNNYRFNNLGFSGTSASAPLVSGIAALMLSANPDLGYRDVQQILILSGRHYDLDDPGLRANGAGLRVSHNVGFGVPNAGQAVQLAKGWINRPALEIVTRTVFPSLEIPDDGLRLITSLPGSLSVQTSTSLGPHPDDPTRVLPLVDVGLATNAISEDLTGKAALIERGTNDFEQKIQFAAEAGAEFAIIYNFAEESAGTGCPGGEQLCPLGGTDFTTIPAVFIRRSDGLALKSALEQSTEILAQLELEKISVPFTITDTLHLEHIGVRLKTDHPLRGDLRITLVSPMGTRSVLQRFNSDVSPGPLDWTYYSTQHFFESSAGQWTLEVSDEFAGGIGALLEASLILRGTTIVDTDKDGLDDDWEMQFFTDLDETPVGDPDGDGYSNTREQLMKTNPTVMEIPFSMDIAKWNPEVARISWPGVEGETYQVYAGSDVTGLEFVTEVEGVFPETVWFTSSSDLAQQFIQVRKQDPL